MNKKIFNSYFLHLYCGFLFNCRNGKDYCSLVCNPYLPNEIWEKHQDCTHGKDFISEKGLADPIGSYSRHKFEPQADRLANNRNQLSQIFEQDLFEYNDKKNFYDEEKHRFASTNELKIFLEQQHEYLYGFFRKKSKNHQNFCFLSIRRLLNIGYYEFQKEKENKNQHELERINIIETIINKINSLPMDQIETLLISAQQNINDSEIDTLIEDQEDKILNFFDRISVSISQERSSIDANISQLYSRITRNYSFKETIKKLEEIIQRLERTINEYSNVVQRLQIDLAIITTIETTKRKLKDLQAVFLFSKIACQLFISVKKFKTSVYEIENSHTDDQQKKIDLILKLNSLSDIQKTAINQNSRNLFLQERILKRIIYYAAYNRNQSFKDYVCFFIKNETRNYIDITILENQIEEEILIEMHRNFRLNQLIFQEMMPIERAQLQPEIRNLRNNLRLYFVRGIVFVLEQINNQVLQRPQFRFIWDHINQLSNFLLQQL